MGKFFCVASVRYSEFYLLHNKLYYTIPVLASFLSIVKTVTYTSLYRGPWFEFVVTNAVNKANTFQLFHSFKMNLKIIEMDGPCCCVVKHLSSCFSPLPLLTCVHVDDVVSLDSSMWGICCTFGAFTFMILIVIWQFIKPVNWSVKKNHAGICNFTSISCGQSPRLQTPSVSSSEPDPSQENGFNWIEANEMLRSWWRHYLWPHMSLHW